MRHGKRQASRMVAPYVLLKPVTEPFRPEIDPAKQIKDAGSLTDADWRDLVGFLGRAECIAIDYETRGTAVHLPETCAVGVAITCLLPGEGELTSRYRWVYLDFGVEGRGRDRWFAELPKIAASARARGVDIVEHNAFFDDGISNMHWLRLGVALGDTRPVATLCTFILYKTLASEGWFGQSWSLKTAQTELLGWETDNTDAVDAWLIDNGYHKQGPKRRGDEQPGEHTRDCEAWIAVNPASRRIAADKGEMWRVPPDILGAYACLDTVSTLDFYLRVLRPVLDQFPELEDFIRGPYMHHAWSHVLQTSYGIRFDRDGALAWREKLQKTQRKAFLEAAKHPQLGPAVRALAAHLAAPVANAKPPKYKVQKERKEPARFTKAGKESANWIKWRALQDKPAEIRQDWLRWRDKLREINRRRPTSPTTKKHTISLSNANHLRKLLYEGLPDLGVAPLVQWEEGEPWQDAKKRGSVWIWGKFGRVELDLTKSGGLPCDVNMLRQLPDDVAKPLLKLAKAFKEESMLTSYIDAAVPDRHRPGVWRVHPSWTMHRALTGRLGGKDPSLHQITKSIDFLDLFLADEGTEYLESDYSALEPHVLAELSGDKALLDLYGPDANPAHDRYLYTLAGIKLPVADPVRKYYDMDNPSKERIGEAKKDPVVSKLRDFAKLLCLAEGTLVRVEGRGFVKVESVLPGDRVWDGVSWVSCGGSVCNGSKRTMGLDGVYLTPDHLVLTKEGWKRASETDSMECVRPGRPSAGWADVWQMVRAIFGFKTRLR